MHTKSISIKEMNDAGRGLAVIADLSAVDHDGDTYAAGAFNWKQPTGQWAPLIPAHHRGKMPFGKTRVYEDGNDALAELHLNLGTQTGRDWHAALKFDLETGQPVQEWSYGYDVLDFEFVIRDGKQVRLLKRLDVHEVSTVIRGAGAGTGTISIKGAQFQAEHFGNLMDNLKAMTDAIQADPTIISATGMKQLHDIHVAVADVLQAGSDDEDAEAKAREMADLAIGSFSKFLAKAHLAKSAD